MRPKPIEAKADYRERFGTSLFGPHTGEITARLGMRWARWGPVGTRWEDHQPKGPDDWRWPFDEHLNWRDRMGFWSHIVLYGRVGWAFEGVTGPLPKDMQWKPDDPRWNDLSVQTYWDKFIVSAVNHYKGRHVIYELENEPEFTGWDKFLDQYALFYNRTARLIKQTDPTAKVMVNNVYGIPSGINAHLLSKFKGQHIDIISWHDYHEGWLASGTDLRRMKERLKELGAGHLEIWFNEGWAYTNTAQDEPAVALTNLNAAQSTNAMVDSIAELTVNGQEKTILFHTAYDDHGQSFWDYAGPGQMLWDFNGYPLPLVAAWNTLIHHIGLSQPVAWVRPPGANFCVFQDLRNGKGVCVAYADREAPGDVKVLLPFAQVIVEDCMGNAAPLKGQTLTLPRNGRPVFVYTTNKTPAKVLSARLAPLDRKNASFVSGGGQSFHLPPTWEGAQRNSAAGNPARAAGKAIWQLNQIWPADPSKTANYRPLIWRDGWWMSPSDDAGGQPKVEMRDAAIRLEFRAATGAPSAERIAGLSFIAPRAATYTVSGEVELKLWDGDVPVRLQLLRKTKAGASEVASLAFQRDARVPLNIPVRLNAGDELVLLPRPGGAATGGDVTLRDLDVSLGSGNVTEYRLPLSWEGAQKGSAQNNPLNAGGRAVWRIDGVWPDDPSFAAHYTPLTWNGTEWISVRNGFGGQPAARVENGTFNVASRGSWTGQEGQRSAGLVFMVPKSGRYRISATARSRPWKGSAATYKLGVFKKDTQRATLEKSFDLPRNGQAVAIDFSLDLTQGHELVFLPLMPDWHNATNTSIENLSIRAGR